MSDVGPDERTTDRAEDLLPEERAAAGDDPEGLAAAVLADSDERSSDAESGTGPDVEHRASDETVEP